MRTEQHVRVTTSRGENGCVTTSSLKTPRCGTGSRRRASRSTTPAKLAILAALTARGALGRGRHPGDGRDRSEFLTRRSRREQATLVVWNRGVRATSPSPLDLGYRAVHIGLPTSTVHLRDSVGKSREWLLNTARDLVEYAKDRGASRRSVPRTSPAPSPRSWPSTPRSSRRRCGPAAVVGHRRRARPGRVRPPRPLIVDAGAIDVQCHAHNDYGLGLANTLAGLPAAPATSTSPSTESASAPA